MGRVINGGNKLKLTYCTCKKKKHRLFGWFLVYTNGIVLVWRHFMCTKKKHTKND